LQPEGSQSSKPRIIFPGVIRENGLDSAVLMARHCELPLVLKVENRLDWRPEKAAGPQANLLL
jgi:hypothetical protein